MVDVAVRARLAVRPEARLQRRSRGGRAQAGVAIHVRRADAGFADHGQRVVLLQEQLAAGVEPEVAPPARSVEQLLRAFDDAVHGRVPVGLDELTALPHERPRQPVRCMVGLPAEEVLGIDPTTVDPVDGPTPHTDHAAVRHSDVQRVAVGVEDRRGLHPPLHVLRSGAGPEIPVHSYRPALTAPVRGARTPRLGDPVHDDLATLFLVHETSRMPPGAAPVAAERRRPTIERQLPMPWARKSSRSKRRRGP